MKNKPVYILLAVVAVVAILLLFGLAKGTAGPHQDVLKKSPTPKPSSSPVPPSQIVQIDGTVQCLLHKGTGPTTTECAYGLKTADGNYYGVTDDSQAITQYQIGERVLVTGTVAPPPANETYQVVGIITASSIAKAQ